MARLVMKFGGTSVADIDRIRNVARHVKREVEAGNEVAVVVSAMAGKTNELVAWTKEIAPFHDAREYDAVVASGEQVTSGLLAMALQSMGVDARSWQGWQIPLRTDNAHGAARIENIESNLLIERISGGQVAVVAGFQGIGPDNRIATLGRGGSDTSAVAIAAAIGADRCDIYTDVDGVYTTDPRIEPRAARMEKISFEEMLEMASLGAKVLQVRSVEMAMVHGVRTFVRSSFDDPDSINSADGSNALVGTLICDEDEIVEKEVVTGIAYTKDEAQISLRRVPDRPGISAAIFGPLAEAHVNVDMIVQSVSEDGSRTDMTFTVAEADAKKAVSVLEVSKDDILFENIQSDTGLAKVSVIGIGMRSHAGVASTAFSALAEKGINIRAITTSEIKFSLLIDADYTELAVRTLHAVYGLND
ncbi:MAG: aspartate kinase [Pseudomonadota bacterium]